VCYNITVVQSVEPLPAVDAELMAQLVALASPEARAAFYARLEHPEALLEALKAEVDKFAYIDGAKALALAERAHELAVHLQTDQALALGRWAYAIGLTVQNRYQEALKHFESARALFWSLGDIAVAHKVATRQLQALAMVGELEAALSLAEATQAGLEAEGLAHDATKLATNVGIILIRLGRYEAAEQRLRSAMASYEALGDLAGVALAKVNLAQTLQQLDAFEEALSHFESAAALFEAAGQTYNLAGTLVEKALLHRRKGQLALVLDTLFQARRLFEQLGSQADAAYAQLEEARIHLELNLFEEAEGLARGALSVFQTHEMQLEALEVEMVLALALARSEQRQEALAVLTKARDGWEALGNAAQVAWADSYIASIMLESGDYTPKVVDTLANEALSTFEALGLRTGQVFCQLLIARVALQQHDAQRALTLLSDAKALALALDVPDLMISTLQLSGQAAVQQGDRTAAERAFRKAIEILEGVRASLKVDEFKASYFNEKRDVYLDFIGLLISQSRFTLAFHFVERAKSRALLDLLAKGLELPQTTDERIAELQRQLQAARNELNRRYLKAEQAEATSPDWAPVRRLEEQITGLIRDIERLTPQESGFEPARVPHFETILEQLDEHTIIIEYFALGDRLIAFVVSWQGLKFVDQLGSVAEVTQLLDRLAFTMNRVAQGQLYEQVYSKEVLKARTDATLKQLYDALIRPLSEALDHKHVVVIPYGALHRVPFAALFDGERYLGEHTQVSLAPSTAIYLHATTRVTKGGERVTAFGVPFEDIPAVRDEVTSVANIFKETQVCLGEAATLAAFRELAPSAGVIHIATHGVYRPDNPMFSGLRFSDGWLSARDLYQLRLNASLVVLSACETGLLSAHSGDEVFGLARGFFYAGAPCLLVSLWAVKDAATSRLMRIFYQALRQGASVAEALQTAQAAVRAQFPNPYYWSAFHLIGDAKRKIV
jgi:CHAT domain-containing protein